MAQAERVARQTAQGQSEQAVQAGRLATQAALALRLTLVTVAAVGAQQVVALVQRAALQSQAHQSQL
jgi:hypothetical protein